MVLHHPKGCSGSRLLSRLQKLGGYVLSENQDCRRLATPMSGHTGRSWGGKEVNGYTDQTLLPLMKREWRPRVEKRMPPRTLFLGLPFAHPTRLAWSSKCNAVSLTQPHGWCQDLVLPLGRGLFSCPSWWKRPSQFSIPTSMFSLRHPAPTS